MAVGNFESGKRTTLSQPVAPADTTIYLASAPTVTSGRLYLKNDAQEERIDFTGVSGNTVTGCSRGMSQTQDPSTSGTGLTWIAGTVVTLVAMHDQLANKLKTNTWAAAQTFSAVASFTAGLQVSGTTSYIGFPQLTTAQRTALTPSNGRVVYDTTIGELYQYIGGAWSAVSAGSTQPNASTTVAGKVEISTSAELLAGTGTGGTGAVLVPDPTILKSEILDKSLRLPMTAGENLTAGDLVYADSDGTARKTVRKASTAAQVSTVTGVDSSTNSTHQIRCEYLDTNTALIVYVKSADNIAYGRIVTFSRGTPTFGTEYALTSAMNTDSGPDVAILSSTLFVVSHKKNADGKAYATACSVSGTTITAGTEVKMYDTEAVYANVSPFCAKVTATSFVIGFQNFASNDPIAVAGTISGTTITAGSSAQLKATAMNVAGHVLCTYVSDGVVAVGYDNGTNIFVNTLTVSGTTITVKTELDTAIAGYCSGSDQILYLGGGTFAFIKNNVASTTRILVYNVADQTNRTVPVMMQNYYIPNDFTTLFNYGYAQYLGNGTLAYVNQAVTSGDVRFRLLKLGYHGSLLPFYDTTIAATAGEVCMSKLTNNQDKVLIIFRDTGTTNLNYSLYWNTENQFVGVVATTTSAAGTVPINNTGTTAISGLTAGQPYYIGDAGAVATSGTKQIGVALTTTSLLLN